MAYRNHMSGIRAGLILSIIALMTWSSPGKAGMCPDLWGKGKVPGPESNQTTIQTFAGQPKTVLNKTDLLVEEALILMREVIMNAIASGGLYAPLDSRNWTSRITEADLDNLVPVRMPMFARASLQRASGAWSPEVVKAVQDLLLKDLMIQAAFVGGGRESVIELLQRRDGSVSVEYLRAMIRLQLTGDEAAFMRRLNELNPRR